MRDKKSEEKKKAKNKYDYVNLKFGSNARAMISKGIVEMSNVVGETFGPLGKNVAISERDDPIIVTKDGVTVAKYIKFSSRKKNLGCRLLSSIAGSTNIHAGDGTTTSTILAAEIVKKGNVLIDIGFHPLEVKKGIEIASKTLLEYLEKTRSFINSEKDLWNLAMIVTNNNEEISNIITQALYAVGNKSIIQIEESQTGNTEIKVEEGMIISNGFASQEYMTSGEDNNVLENALILVVKSPITEISDIIKTIEYVKCIDRPLVIFSPEIKKEPLSVLLYNRRKDNLNVIAVNVPDYINDQSNLEILKDICTMTGAKFCSIEDLQDNNLESSLIFEDNFGASRKCKVNEIETVLIGVKGDKEEIQDMISALETRTKTETNLGYKSYYKERISRLQGKSCTIYIGGITPVEVTENRDKIVDALNSCQTSIEMGILPGGGSAYIHSLKILEKLKYSNNNLNVGVNIFYEALINTLKVLYKNLKMNPDSLIEKIKSKDNPLYGYNLHKREFCENMIEEGIIDSFNTIKTAIEDSVSVAGLLITTECVVYKEIDYEPPPLDAFRNRIKNDPEYRNKVKNQFYESTENDDDYKLFSSVI